jgi:DnaJ-class molecular chaperone
VVEGKNILIICLVIKKNIVIFEKNNSMKPQSNCSFCNGTGKETLTKYVRCNNCDSGAPGRWCEDNDGCHQEISVDCRCTKDLND